MSGDFYSSMKIGDAGEAAWQSFAMSMENILACVKVDYRKYGYDFMMMMDNRSTQAVEVKSLAGANKQGRAYPTFAVEAWADDDMTRRPHWWAAAVSGDLNYIVFISRYHKRAYVFNPKALTEYVEGKTDYTRCHDGNKNAPGVIVKVRWTERSAGFVREVDMKDYM